MKAGLGWLVASIALAFSVALWLEGKEQDAEQLRALERKEADIRMWQARYAEEASHVERAVDTVRVMVRRVDTLRQTLNIHDTTEVIRYAAATDTALQACSELANDCRQFRATADSLLTSQRAVIDWWVKHDKPHHSLRTKLRERIGLTCGYGVTASQGQAYVGPQCGITVRLIP